MASIGINAAMHRACSSPHLATKEVKEPSQLGATRSLGTKQASTLVSLNVEDQNALITPQKQKKDDNVAESGHETETSSVKFVDERWKQGTWDLNMFVKSGKMDWDALIVAGHD